MEQRFDLAAEMERRSLGPVELARAAKVSRSTIADVRSGRSPRAATRRKLVLALSAFQPVAGLDGPRNGDAKVATAATAAGRPRPVSTADPRVTLENLRRRRHLAQLKENAP